MLGDGVGRRIAVMPLIGNVPSAKGMPRLAMLIALPRAAVKPRTMPVIAVWVISPWPVRRKANSARNRNATVLAKARAKVAAINPRQTSTA